MTPSAARVLACSIPVSESALADSALPGVKVDVAPLVEAITRAPARTEVVSVAATDAFDGAVLTALAGLKHLRAIVTRSDGYDHFPADWMRERAIAGYHLGDYATGAVARYAIAAVLALLRRIPEGAAITRGGAWDRSRLESRDLGDVTVGVLGTGRIGGRVARDLMSLGARVIGHDIAPDPSLEGLAGFRYVADFDGFLGASDVLSIHVPLTSSTRDLVDASTVARLPARACVVNTARGDIVDQAAIEDALATGHLEGYATDVLPGEPTPPDVARFARFGNVIVTPHIAAFDAHTIRERHARSGRIVRALLARDDASVLAYRCIG